MSYPNFESMTYDDGLSLVVQRYALTKEAAPIAAALATLEKQAIEMPDIAKIKASLSEFFSRPEVYKPAIGAGVGAVGGMAAQLLKDERRRRYGAGALSGAAIGGLAGAGLHYGGKAIKQLGAPSEGALEAEVNRMKEINKPEDQKSLVRRVNEAAGRSTFWNSIKGLIGWDQASRDFETGAEKYRGKNPVNLGVIPNLSEAQKRLPGSRFVGAGIDTANLVSGGLGGALTGARDANPLWTLLGGSAAGTTLANRAADSRDMRIIKGQMTGGNETSMGLLNKAIKKVVDKHQIKTRGLGNLPGIRHARVGLDRLLGNPLNRVLHGSGPDVSSDPVWMADKAKQDADLPRFEADAAKYEVDKKVHTEKVNRSLKYKDTLQARSDVAKQKHDAATKAKSVLPPFVPKVVLPGVPTPVDPHIAAQAAVDSAQADLDSAKNKINKHKTFHEDFVRRAPELKPQHKAGTEPAHVVSRYGLRDKVILQRGSRAQRIGGQMKRVGMGGAFGMVPYLLHVLARNSGYNNQQQAMARRQEILDGVTAQQNLDTAYPKK